MPGQIRAVPSYARAPVTFFLDGRPCAALAGDTILTAILRHARSIGARSFGGGGRAGFCAIGACQDCWVELEDGRRLRACTTQLAGGLRITTGSPS